MKQIIYLAVFGFAACGRLDSQYLPPQQSGYSTGQYSRTSGQFSSTSAQYSRPGTQYSSPTSQNSRPASQYSSPTNQFSRPASHYSRPASQYSSPVSQYSGTTSQYSGEAAQQIPILRLDENNNGDGTYNYAYETANGIVAGELGDARGDGTRAQGGFSYKDPNGQLVQIQYTADENGYQPQGAHVPQIPEAIRKSIAFNLAEEARGVVDDGQYRAGSSAQYGASQQYTSRPQYNAPRQPQYVAPQQYKYPQNNYLPPTYRG